MVRFCERFHADAWNLFLFTGHRIFLTAIGLSNPACVGRPVVPSSGAWMAHKLPLPLHEGALGNSV
jgi:hypothetical protein